MANGETAMQTVERIKQHGGSVYFIKGWHLWLTVGTILITIGVEWGTMKAQLDQTTRDIADMKAEKYVPKTDYWRDNDELRRMIEQMNGKLDAMNRLLK